MRNSVTCPPFPQPKISTRLGPPSVGPTCRDHPRYLLPPQFLHRLLVPRYPPFFPGTPRNCTPTGGPSRDAPKLGHDEPALARLKQVKRLHRLRQTSSSFYKGKGSFSSSYLPFCHPLPHCPPYFTLASDSPSSPESPLPAIGNSPDSMAAVLFPFGVGSW